MATQAPATIAVPEIRIYGVGDINRIKPHYFEGKIDTGITSYGKKLKDIQSDSIKLRDQATLFEAWLASEIGEYELPKDVKQTLDQLFGDKGKGNVTHDAVNYDKGKKHVKKPSEGYRSVQAIVGPEDFVLKDGVWQAKIGKDSEVYGALLPPPGYSMLTNDGLTHPNTGYFFATAPTREQAEQSFINRGYSPELAKKAVSYIYTRNEGEGTAAVIRWYVGLVSGRFRVDASYGPDGSNGDIGSFPASSKPSGARRADGKLAILMSKAEEIEQSAKYLQEEIESLQE